MKPKRVKTPPETALPEETPFQRFERVVKKVVAAKKERINAKPKIL